MDSRVSINIILIIYRIFSLFFIFLPSSILLSFGPSKVYHLSCVVMNIMWHVTLVAGAVSTDPCLAAAPI